jgi:hypothetical protein
MISDVAGIPPERILLAATHTHTSFRPGGSQSADPTALKLGEIVRTQTLQAVRMATANLQPARMAYGTGKAYINTNRDQEFEGQYTLGYNPDRPSDKTVQILRFDSVATGEPIAFLINYAVHAVVMHGTVTRENNGRELSADIPGVTSTYVEKHFQYKPVAVWTSGAAGDQAPLFTATYNRGLPDRTDYHAAGYVLLDVLSRRLAEEVIRVSDRTAADVSNVSIWGGETTAICPGGRITRDPISGQVSSEDAPPVELKLQALTINDVALTGVNGEVVSIIGEHMKQASPFAKTIFVTHTGRSVGYIPDDASYPLVTFEVTRSRMKPGCSENAIINGLVGLLKSSAPTVR